MSGESGRREGSPGDANAGRIDQAWYDDSTYFDGDTAHLTDLDSPFQRYRIRKVLDIAAPAPTDRVVDLGCGWGTFEFVLADRVREIVGIDFSARSIELCNDRLAREPRDNVRFVQADAGDTGLAAGAWDLVICADLFEHLYPEDSQRVAAEAFRLLRPGGRFSVWTPHRGHILEILKNNRILLKPDPSHVDYKSMARMKGLVTEAGFEIERAYYAESHLPGLRAAERMLSGIVPFLRRRIAVLGRKPPST
ncbi:MAG: class I SAM-dependent methyltransferase [Gemmatimonadetes bacterium]|nr:class I SAM-dependent methyltransferase [Gemmatimonadota bacterium]